MWDPETIRISDFEFHQKKFFFDISHFHLMLKDPQKYSTSHLSNFPKDSKRFQQILKDSKKFQKIPKDFKRFQKIPKDSKRFQKNQKDSTAALNSSKSWLRLEILPENQNIRGAPAELAWALKNKSTYMNSNTYYQKVPQIYQACLSNFSTVEFWNSIFERG